MLATVIALQLPNKIKHFTPYNAFLHILGWKVTNLNLKWENMH